VYKFEFKNKAAQSLDKLPSQIRNRILIKLKFYSSQNNPLDFAERLTDYEMGDWRFRVGDYRIIFDADGDKIIILKIGHRKDIYKC